jgi:hypothetical protein
MAAITHAVAPLMNGVTASWRGSATECCASTPTSFNAIFAPPSRSFATRSAERPRGRFA